MPLFAEKMESVRRDRIGAFALGCATMVLASADFVQAGALVAAKAETACDYAIAAVHGPVGPAADAHAPAGLPAANWTHAPFTLNYSEVPVPPAPNVKVVRVDLQARHIVPTCHPGLDAPMGAVWGPSWTVATNAPPAGGVLAVTSGATRNHAPHDDIFAGTLTVNYNAAGGVAGYTFSSTGKHDPENCMAECAVMQSSQTVPLSNTSAFGSASFVIDGLTMECSVSVAVRGIARAQVIGAAIHVGGPGQVGPPILDLGGAAVWQDLQGVGISRMELGVPFPAQYLHALQQGQTYVNIQTMSFPQGELRGQLRIPLMAGGGDMNCDGVMDELDVGPFVLALLDANAYEAQYPTCDIGEGDINGDGKLDGLDVAELVEGVPGQ